MFFNFLILKTHSFNPLNYFSIKSLKFYAVIIPLKSIAQFIPCFA